MQQPPISALVSNKGCGCAGVIGAPELIVADEPTSSLDRNRQQRFLDLLFADVEAAGATLIMVSHDESLSDRFTRVENLQDIAKTARRGSA